MLRSYCIRPYRVLFQTKVILPAFFDMNKLVCIIIQWSDILFSFAVYYNVEQHVSHTGADSKCDTNPKWYIVASATAV